MIPRTSPRCTDLPDNIATICGSCHNEVHAGQKIIEGRFATTGGVRLFWHKHGDACIITEGIILNDLNIADKRKE